MRLAVISVFVSVFVLASFAAHADPLAPENCVKLARVVENMKSSQVSLVGNLKATDKGFEPLVVGRKALGEAVGKIRASSVKLQAAQQAYIGTLDGLLDLLRACPQ